VHDLQRGESTPKRDRIADDHTYRRQPVMVKMHYDFIIAGGGAAGLSLAYQMIYSPLSKRNILIVDKDDDDQLLRNWGFWMRPERLTAFDQVEHHAWNRLEFICGDESQHIELGSYQYRLMHGAHFYRFALEQLAACPNVSFARGVIDRIEDGPQEARVVVNEVTYSAEWVFDSVVKPAELKCSLNHHQFLLMQFKGWEIETPQPAFDPGCARLMDFRTPQAGQMRFFYVMPYSATHALVEFTAFTSNILAQETYESALNAYLDQVLGGKGYDILSVENGAVPITDYPFKRQEGQRVMTIGAKGGRIKPSTGYSFMRIQKDSQAIVQRLVRTGQPFGVPKDPAFYQLCDAMMLRIMSKHGAHIGPIFAAMFRNNPIQSVLRFLDEESTPLETLRLIVTLPVRMFLLALL
jgi:lycopene beta-cyclase